MTKFSLNGSWNLSGKDINTKARIPGDFHTALIENGFIKDPFYGFNEKDQLWVGQTDWTIQREFVYKKKDNYKSILNISFADTFFTLFINNKEVAGLNRRNYKTFDGYTPFNQFKARFRFLMFGEESSRRNEYLKYLKVQPFDRVLEVGVGIGTNIMCLSPNARYYGVDSSLTHLNECVKLKFKYRLSLQLCLCSP